MKSFNLRSIKRLVTIFIAILMVVALLSFTSCVKQEKVRPRLVEAQKAPAQKRLGSGQLRIYRLALAATGEYTRYFGGKEKAIAAQLAALDRVNQLYEKELSVRLVLIPDNHKLVFTDPETDPYSVTNANQMMLQNQKTIDSIIGSQNYDIGHLFFVFKKGDGISQNSGVCGNDTKAQGVTGAPDPEGDSFYIDYVAHEMGHQIGAHHTMSNRCQEYPPTAVEPGSGSTIMSYAGICFPNVQKHNDPYFHSVSLEEITGFLTTRGSECAQTSPLPGQWPHIDYMTTAADIPASTPFLLSARASDPDGDDITYCWEQANPGTDVPMPPRSSFTDGPLFRSLSPTSGGDRYFPPLTDLVTGQSPRWQVLPSEDADLKFNLTVRDNAPGGGRITLANSRVIVHKSAGPFQVDNPGETAWTAGEEYQITWSVANTDQAPIACGTVDIVLSSDGGRSFDHYLAAGVPNNGSARVKAPKLESDGAYLMIRAKNNIFFTVTNRAIKLKEKN